MHSCSGALRDIQEQSFTVAVAAVCRCFSKQAFLRFLAIFTGKHLCQSLFFNKVQDHQTCNSIKNRLQHRCFPMNIAKFSRTAFFIEHLRWLFLQVLYKKAVPKNFANFTRTFRYRSPILSSCWLTTCNFVIIVGRGEVFCCEFGEIFQNNFMRNSFERLLLNVKVTLMQI